MIESKLLGQLTDTETQKNTSKTLGVCLASLGHNLEKGLIMTKQELQQKVDDLQCELDSKDTEIETLEANIESLQKIARDLINQVQSLGGDVSKLSPCVFTRNAAKDLLFEIPNIENQIDDIYSARF